MKPTAARFLPSVASIVTALAAITLAGIAMTAWSSGPFDPLKLLGDASAPRSAVAQSPPEQARIWLPLGLKSSPRPWAYPSIVTPAPASATPTPTLRLDATVTQEPSVTPTSSMGRTQTPKPSPTSPMVRTETPGPSPTSPMGGTETPEPTATLAEASTLYVDAFAAQGGNGSRARPFREIQAALDVIDVVRPLVLVAPGEYAPIRTLRAGPDRVDGRGGFRIIARPRRQAIVRGESGRSSLEVEHPNYRFEGLVFDGAYVQRDGIQADGGDHLVLSDIEVRRYARDCIDLGRTRDILIEDSQIHHCVGSSGGAQVDAHGVTGNSVFDLTIRDTDFYLITGDGVQLSPPRLPWDNLLISNCRFSTGALDEQAGSLPAGTLIGENAVDTKVPREGDLRPKLRIEDVVAFGYKGAITNEAAFNIKERVDAVIDRVTVYDSEIAFRLRAPALLRVQNALVFDVHTAFRLEDGLRGMRLYNVTVGRRVERKIRDAGGEPIGLDVRNSLFLGSGLPEFVSADANNLPATRGFFVDVDSDDYHLADGSPAIDAGATLADVTDDRDGIPRPQGAAYDVGAYER